jgi:hypothetical protein
VSRAFVKESDGRAETLPDRPVSPHPNLVTPEGLALIDTTVERACATSGRPRSAQTIRPLWHGSSASSVIGWPGARRRRSFTRPRMPPW